MIDPGEGGQVQRLDLHRGLRIGMAVAAFVLPLEGVPDLRGIGAARHQHLDIVALPDIAHFNMALESCDRTVKVPFKCSGAICLHLAVDRVHRTDCSLTQTRRKRSHVIDSRLGQCHANGREITRLHRDDDHWNGELARQRTGVQRPTTTIGYERKVARVASVVDGNSAYDPGHDHRCNGHHPGGHAYEPLFAHVTQRVRDASERRPCCIHLKVQLTAEEIVGIESPEHQIGIGHRGLLTTTSVAGRAG